MEEHASTLSNAETDSNKLLGYNKNKLPEHLFYFYYLVGVFMSKNLCRTLTKTH